MNMSIEMNTNSYCNHFFLVRKCKSCTYCNITTILNSLKPRSPTCENHDKIKYHFLVCKMPKNVFGVSSGKPND